MRLPSFFWSTQFNYQISLSASTQLNYVANMRALTTNFR